MILKLEESDRSLFWRFSENSQQVLYDIMKGEFRCASNNGRIAEFGVLIPSMSILKQT
jgi:hypothetical protein